MPTLIRGLKPRAQAKKWEPYGEASLPIEKDGALPRQRVRKTKGRAGSPSVPTLVEGSAGCSHGTPPPPSLWRTRPLPRSPARRTPQQSGAATIQGWDAAAPARGLHSARSRMAEITWRMASSRGLAPRFPLPWTRRLTAPASASRLPTTNMV